MKEFKYCKACVMLSSRPGLKMNIEGVCSACLWNKKKVEIDWNERKAQFQEIANWAKDTTRSAWDCVLGVSGGKDSLWQAHQVRDVFGLNLSLIHI